MGKTAEKKELVCAHCGDLCRDDSVKKGELVFCCTGCLFVYEMLQNEELEDVYELTKQAGIKPKALKEGEYAFLDDKKVQEKLLNYSINGRAKITLYLPNIYCSACIWLLENLFRLDKGIEESKVNFLKKEIAIVYDEEKTSLRKIAELLASLGYAPKLNLGDMEKKKPKNPNMPLYIKLGVAGFSFGNVMLLAFPEYLSGGSYEPEIMNFIRYLILIFAIPTLYAASDYFKSAWKGLKLRHINIDVPISIGIITLFARSAHDILAGAGQGFIDSMAGLVFFLLIGRLFQQKTYHRLSFDRDYKSFFPLTVLKKNGTGQKYVTISEILPGDTILIRNNELIPTDSVLLSEKAYLDYSFVTGESMPVEVEKNGKIYSGGRLSGATVEIQVMKPFKQSYLTELWNSNKIGSASESYMSRLSNTAAKYFTILVLGIASAALFYWLPIDSATAWNAFTAVLIIACPCALALTIPFTYGTAMRVFGNKKFFLKNDKIVEYLSKIDTIIFDKTGTLTDVRKSTLQYEGKKLSEEEKGLIKSAVKNSTHPISRMIFEYLGGGESEDADSYEELPGSGLEAYIKGRYVRIGSVKWVGAAIPNFSKEVETEKLSGFSRESSAFISIDNEYKGNFLVKTHYREKTGDLLKKLKEQYEVVILSGDRDTEQEALERMSGGGVKMHFNKLPDEKLHFVRELQKSGKHVLMTGDGLNDAGALQQADAGIAVTDETSNFTPGADAILQADSLNILTKFLNLSKRSFATVLMSFGISITYNTIGMYFAVQGLLSPLFAAVLMPISSISVVLFTVGKVNLDARIIGLKK